MIFNKLSQLNQALPSKLQQALPSKGRLMALDLGTKRIGFALSDESRLIATPKLILHRQNNQNDLAKISEFAKQNQVAAIVIGHPIDMDGNRTAMTIVSEKFATELDAFLLSQLPIFLFEERLTSFEARGVNVSGISARRNKFVDDIAASFILQHFLDVIRAN